MQAHAALTRTRRPEMIFRARQLRKDATDAENVLWRRLRGRRCAGVKFRRQHPVGNFILDFYAPSMRLAIEVDGGGHADDVQARYDQQRTMFLKRLGIRVLRFWNHDVLKREELVMAEIYRVLTPLSA